MWTFKEQTSQFMPVSFRYTCLETEGRSMIKVALLKRRGSKVMDSLNMHFMKQTYSIHNGKAKLAKLKKNTSIILAEWKIMFFHSPTQYYAINQCQGTWIGGKCLDILSSSSSESFWMSWPSPDSWVKLSILSLPFLYFCCLALMRSIL